MSDKASTKRLLGMLYPFFILGYVGVIYYGLIVRIYILKPLGVLEIIFLAVFHFLLLMILWAYFSAMLVDPGRPPNFWGFYLDDPEQRRKKYCLICHAYKPERCHHCSTCGKCVLNMDHHCPWLNNCVGFFNRKYFFQLICYTWVALLLALIAGAIPLTILTISAINKSNMPSGYSWLDFIFLWIAFVMICVLFITLTIFIEFHMTLIENNSTTIENLEDKSSGSGSTNYQYDQGSEFNWNQVMGKNRFLWLIPYIGKAGYPNGDGVVFPSRNERQESFVDNAGTSHDGTDPDGNNPLINLYQNQKQNQNQNNNFQGYTQSDLQYGNGGNNRAAPYRNNFEMSNVNGSGAGVGYPGYSNNSGLGGANYMNSGMSQQFNGGGYNQSRPLPGNNMNPYSNGANPLTGGRMGGNMGGGAMPSRNPLNQNFLN